MVGACSSSGLNNFDPWTVKSTLHNTISKKFWIQSVPSPFYTRWFKFQPSRQIFVHLTKWSFLTKTWLFTWNPSRTFSSVNLDITRHPVRTWLYFCTKFALVLSASGAKRQKIQPAVNFVLYLPFESPESLPVVTPFPISVSCSSEDIDSRIFGSKGFWLNFPSKETRWRKKINLAWRTDLHVPSRKRTGRWGDREFWKWLKLSNHQFEHWSLRLSRPAFPRWKSIPVLILLIPISSLNTAWLPRSSAFEAALIDPSETRRLTQDHSWSWWIRWVSRQYNFPQCQNEPGIIMTAMGWRRRRGDCGGSSGLLSRTIRMLSLFLDSFRPSSSFSTFASLSNCTLCSLPYLLFGPDRLFLVYRSPKSRAKVAQEHIVEAHFGGKPESDKPLRISFQWFFSPSSFVAVPCLPLRERFLCLQIFRGFGCALNYSDFHV